MFPASKVLILEDSLFIAMEAEDILREIGVETIEIASSTDQAMAALEAATFDFALLDVNLGESMSFDFARLLKRKEVPFGFVSGYSDTQDFPDDLRSAPLLVKPFDQVAMREMLAQLFPATT